MASRPEPDGANWLNLDGRWTSVGASRFGARVAIELLGYQPSDVIKMQFVRKWTLPWVPEPLRWIGVRLTQQALIKADKNNGKRGLWLKLLDALNLGFTC